MLVVDDARDQHVADVRVQRGRLAEHVDAAQRGRVDGDLAQDVVRGHPERIVDVDDPRPARRQRVRVDIAEARIERRDAQTAERDDLGRHAQRRRAANVLDAVRLLGRPALGRALLAAAR